MRLVEMDRFWGLVIRTVRRISVVILLRMMFLSATVMPVDLERSDQKALDQPVFRSV